MKRSLLICFALMFALLQQALAQSKTVSGTVTDQATGQGLPGVSVIVKGTTVGTATGGNGSYTVNVPESASTLVFKYIGYATKEVPVGNQSVVNVALGVDAEQLGEVVIVGAGGIERQAKEQGYTTTTIATEELTQGKTPNIASGLTGKVAGLQINAVSSGVNPNVRVTLRGNRSLTGNNEALIVLDNVIVPNTVLGNLNPEDVETITVLNGGNAAALYGSDASNGAVLITTKKGIKGVTRINLSHTTTFEEISFFPDLQNQFGSGSSTGEQVYIPFENQQYGPAFDGSMVEIGKPLADGSIQTVPYTARDDKYDFWETGLSNQTDFSISSGSDKSTFYASGQRLDVSGTTPEDKYNRTSVRINGTHELSDKFNFSFNTNYTQNFYDITNQTASIYDALLQTPAHIPLLDYKDWRNNPFANPNGYYNEYYDNPYFLIDNNRQETRNNYIIGNFELKFAPVEWLEFTGRAGVTSRNTTEKTTAGKFTLTDYTKEISSSKTDIAGGVGDYSLATTQLNSDFLAQIRKDFNDFSLNLILGTSIRNNYSKFISISGNGLVNPGLYNISNRVGEPGASEASYQARQVGVYADMTIGFRDYLFLHATGRNDWVSILAPENRSFFYPAIDIAFTATDAIPALQNSSVISLLKIRGGVSKVGQVNLGSRTNFGAYSLEPTFLPTGGFPYGSLTGYSLSNLLVSADLKPEITTGYEFGFDAVFLNDVISTKFTYYKTNTTDQTVTTGVSKATGFSAYLVNSGETENQGVETALHISPISTETWSVTIGGNYTYQDGKVLSISSDLDRLQLSFGGDAQVYAVAGEAFPVLLGTDYVRDDQGRIIVDRISGYPTQNPELQILGSTEPKHRLGLDMEVRYKNFRLTSLFEYRGDYVRYHDGGGSFDFSGSSARSAQYNRDRFVIPNSSYLDPETGEYVANTNITVADGGAGFFANGDRNLNVASNFVTSGEYWRWREASLEYELPQAWLASTVKFVKAASVSIQARNLKLWLPDSNQYSDPDYSFAGSESNAIGITTLSQTPPTRYYGATVSVSF
ncbi:SusC/RagA family TonB-linked outer membrane protein [Pontibacter sp. 172403-2]|uniref:SusC/RagA family TonB-linked outer membrane protein n=1 Tax=Pontibacter rufus TaxID=2791028 RepID=UPI0018AFDC32|nr:SusC/RagA family TonB-linked outer membrane protein [Pontibacter sp. 172403-2]MBF9251822.1 SusC/RagA family TonB-linked outer membrane protein [Pontibacter sp. 172403-2]